MSYIDTRDLIETRDNLKEQILDDFNERFNTELDDFNDVVPHMEDESNNLIDDDVDDFYADWEDKFQQINEIDEVENAVGSEFTYGCTLIEEDDFVDYVKDLLEDCGYISKDFPSWIEIDWEATSENVKQDYSEVEYQGETYYFRS